MVTRTMNATNKDEENVEKDEHGEGTKELCCHCASNVPYPAENNMMYNCITCNWYKHL